jgi:acetyl esterase/lipase
MRLNDIVGFQRQLKRAGVRCELYLYPAQIHAFFNHEP